MKILKRRAKKPMPPGSLMMRQHMIPPRGFLRDQRINLVNNFAQTGTRMVVKTVVIAIIKVTMPKLLPFRDKRA